MLQQWPGDQPSVTTELHFIPLPISRLVPAEFLFGYFSAHLGIKDMMHTEYLLTANLEGLY